MHANTDMSPSLLRLWRLGPTSIPLCAPTKVGLRCWSPWSRHKMRWSRCCWIMEPMWRRWTTCVDGRRLLQTHMLPQDGWTALHIAANAGNEDLCTILLGCGAPVNATTPLGEASLHMAVGQRQAGIVNQLLSCQNIQVNPICAVRYSSSVTSHTWITCPSSRYMYPLEMTAKAMRSKQSCRYVVNDDKYEAKHERRLHARLRTSP